MRVGDLVKIIYKDGAISSELGIYLGQKKASSNWRLRFLIDGHIVQVSPVEYHFEAIK